ncbi:MAG: hypothetical protein E7062_07515 [Spirochaetaceae bacterium]|nr:hypothetical protein [Spirochaetaceae bacterium]
MGTKKGGLGFVFIQIALAIFLIVSGIITVQLDGSVFGNIKASFSGNEIASAVYNIFGHGDISGLIIIVLGIFEIIAGVFLFMRFFVAMGKWSDTFLFIIMCFWIAVIVLVDILGSYGILGSAFESTGSFMAFLKSLSSHLLVLGSMLLVQRS